ncbi:MAG: antitoxin family protein [Candidatus Parabeggiatoa sp.]|nr:antitoxin family protein [Candidatus Parabeggiatoa sp.]
MNSNPLPAIWETYKLTKDSLRVVKRAVKTRNPADRLRLLQRTIVLNQQPEIFNVDNLANIAELEIEELFVVSLWAAFERFIRDYLQHKGILLMGITPTNLGQAIYDHFFEEVEYWKPDEILDFLKRNLLQHNPQLAGDAKAIYHYRSWIVHGKSERTRHKINPLSTEQAYTQLNDIIQVLLAHLGDSPLTAIFDNGVFRPIQPYNALTEGQIVQLVIIKEKTNDEPNVSS